MRFDPAATLVHRPQVTAPILCVAGTGPGVGTTVVAAALVRRARAIGGHPVGMKPVDVGCRHGDDHDIVSDDGARLRAARERPLPPLVAAPYRFSTPGPPLTAARRAGLVLRVEHLAEAVQTAAEYGNVVVVDLCGGAHAPIAEDGLGLDLVASLGARLLAVDTPAPGVESRVLALLEGARHRDIDVAGVMLNAPTPAAVRTSEVEATVAEVGSVRVFPSLPTLAGDPELAAAGHLAEHRILEQLFGPS